MIGPNLDDPALTGLTEGAAVGHPLLTAVIVGLVVRLLISARESRSLAPWLLLVWAGAELGGDLAYGYLAAAGDQLLVEAARRLHRTVRDGDTVARLGGDEFTVLLPEASSAEAEVAAHRIRSELAAPLEIDGEILSIATSIGIAEAADRHTHPEELLREADAALYAAKEAGKGRHELYAPGLERATSLTLSGIAPQEAKAWADYMRELRLEIADRKLTGVIAGQTRAPENVHRTFQRVLVAIDHLQDDASTATLVLPARRDVEEFVFHQTAVHHWADALVARGELTVGRPAEADRFWSHLERVSTGAYA